MARIDYIEKKTAPAEVSPEGSLFLRRSLI